MTSKMMNKSFEEEKHRGQWHTNICRTYKVNDSLLEGIETGPHVIPSQGCEAETIS